MPNTLEVASGLPVVDNGWVAGWPGAYVFYRRGRPYYVGMAGDVPCRLQEHRRAGLPLVAESISVYPVMTAVAARRLERNLILLHRPSSNSALPNVSANEQRWFHALWMATVGPNKWDEQVWGWCRECGELYAFIGGAHLRATFGAECDSCEDTEAWDPLGFAWHRIGYHVGALFGFVVD